MKSHLAQLTALLDHVAGRLTEGDVTGPVRMLIEELWALCLGSPRGEWLEELAPACRRHRLHGLLLQDPYTARAFKKPRGYAGDAEMIDYVYCGLPPDGTTALGRAVFQETTGGPNGLSVRARRDLFAKEIEATCRRVVDPVILSVGCGHLREAQHAPSVRPDWGGRLYALDQDKESLAVVAREQAANNVQTVCCPVRSLLRGQPQMAGLDLVYASGLFDYFPDELAARLIRSLFGMLRTGGRLLLANFAPDSHGRGYMEAFMDWKLVYRNEAAIAALADAVPKEQVARRSISWDHHRNIVFLELTRLE